MEVAYKEVDKYCFDIRKPIGSGNYSTVYQAFEKANDDNKFAIKMIPVAILKRDDLAHDLVVREIKILKQIKHPNIVQMIDAMQTVNNVYIILEYCDGGDLSAKLKEKIKFTEESAIDIIRQITEAFLGLGRVGSADSQGQKTTIMHRDIKPANILFHQGQVKLADFGFAKIIENSDSNNKMKHTLLGTPYYMSPQLLIGESYTNKCDVWSAGILLYELLFGKRPWEGQSENKLYMNIVENPLVISGSVKEEVKDLIMNMLEVDEVKRLSWKQVREHPALNIDKV